MHCLLNRYHGRLRVAAWQRRAVAAGAHDKGTKTPWNMIFDLRERETYWTDENKVSSLPFSPPCLVAHVASYQRSSVGASSESGGQKVAGHTFRRAARPSGHYAGNHSRSRCCYYFHVNICTNTQHPCSACLKSFCLLITGSTSGFAWHS